MDWLSSNPIANLSGPQFLLVYALFALAVVIVSRMQISAADTSAATALPNVTVDRDPGEVAYLRGGGNELLRFTIFDLTRLGFLRVADPPKAGKAPTQIVATGQVEGTPALTLLQQKAIEFYAVPHTTAELFASDLPKVAKAYGDAAYRPRLDADGFYVAPAVRSTATLVRLYGALALALFAAYRFFTAALRHHNNVIFLAIETVVALLVLFTAARPSGLSKRGRAYLERLASALKPMPVAPVAAGVGILPILVAATGIEALAGTEYAPMTGLFPHRSKNGSDGCSGGCGSASSGAGSSCSSGSGCGGGGGCGG
jgi:uncharacterized protein (TIGR04222 family)